MCGLSGRKSGSQSIGDSHYPVWRGQRGPTKIDKTVGGGQIRTDEGPRTGGSTGGWKGSWWAREGREKLPWHQLTSCCKLNNNWANPTHVCDCWSLNQSSEYWIYDFEIKLYIQPCQNEIRQPGNNIVTRLYILITWVFFKWLWHGCDKHVHNPVTIISQPCRQSCSILVQAWQYYQLSMSKLPRLWETPTLVQCCN